MERATLQMSSGCSRAEGLGEVSWHGLALTEESARVSRYGSIVGLHCLRPQRDATLVRVGHAPNEEMVGPRFWSKRRVCA
eukprot:152306-Lingulodinium_polyedra.AAC.1